MPRTISKNTINAFTAGLITDRTELTSAPNSTTDEDNCIITKKGARARRQGFVLTGTANGVGNLVTTHQITDGLIGSYEWMNPGKLGDVKFIVIQVGTLLYFFDATIDPLADGLKDFAVNLLDFAAPSAGEAIANTYLSVASGNGALFVTGETVNPFYIDYDPTTDTITTAAVTISIRDFDEQEPTIQQAIPPFTPGFLYDVYNQGWITPALPIEGGNVDFLSVTGTMVDGYTQFVTAGHFGGPIVSKAVGWFVGIEDRVEGRRWNASTYLNTAFAAGSSKAAFGHFILNAFNKDRAGVSGVTGVTGELKTTRPTATCFFSGRAWWLHEDKLYYSQIMEDNLGKAGFCYQVADPTSSEDSALVATDGGVVRINDLGKGLAMFNLETALIIIANNGVWSVSGSTGSGFTATDFSVSRVSSVRSLSGRTVVNASGYPIWFGESGIFTLRPKTIGGYEVADLTIDKINDFYNTEISTISKIYATGAFDPTGLKVIWGYNSILADEDNGEDRFVLDKFLLLDLKFGAFIPWSIETDPEFPRINGIVSTSRIGSSEAQEDVTDNGGEDVVDAANQQVTALIIKSKELATNLKFFTTSLQSSTVAITDFSLGTVAAVQTAPVSYHDGFIDTLHDKIYNIDLANTKIYSYDQFTGNNNYNTTVTQLKSSPSFFSNIQQKFYLRTDTGSNFATYGLVDPAIGTTITSFGTASATSPENRSGVNSNSSTYILAPRLAVVHGFGSREFVCFSMIESVAKASRASIWELTNGTMSIQNDTDFFYHIDGVDGNVIAIGKGPTTTTSCSFWLAVGNVGTGSSPTEIDFYKVSTPGYSQTLIRRFSLSDLDPLWTGMNNSEFSMLTDPVDGFPVIFIGRGSGSGNRAYMFKIDPSLGTIIWKTTWAHYRLIGRHTNLTHQEYRFFSDGDGAGSNIWGVDLRDGSIHTTAFAHITGDDSTIIGHYDASENVYHLRLDTWSDAGSPTPVKYGTFAGANSSWSNRWTALWLGPADFGGVGNALYYLGFAEPISQTFKDWYGIDLVGKDYDSFMLTYYNIVEDPAMYFQVPYVYAYLTKTEDSVTFDGDAELVYDNLHNLVVDSNTSEITALSPDYLYPSSCLLQTRWDFANSSVAHKFGRVTQLYRNVKPYTITSTNDWGYPILVTKNKIRGKGRALQMKFYSETGKDFQLVGWMVFNSKNQNV